MSGYAELQVTSNFSFLRGASHPFELVGQAERLGHRAIALTDRNTLAGIVRAHAEIKRQNYKVRLIVGARLDLDDGPSLLCLPTDRAAYGRLTKLLTIGKRRAAKGECRLHTADVLAHGEGQIMIVVPPERPDDGFAATLAHLGRHFAGRCYLAAHYLYRGDDERRLRRLAQLAPRCGTPLVATNDVHFHVPERRPLQDVLTCIREKCTIHEAGYRLFANAERHLKPPEEMARLFRHYPEAIARTIEIAARCRFSLDELRYEYPAEMPADGRTPQEELVRLTWEGAARRYPDGIPEKVRRTLEQELALIAEKNYAPYFLTVNHIVEYARRRDIYCQGRGSAANSAVCYCLHITEVDPAKNELLFARFISAARNEPPDIDVDFEHERREEVVQYIYGKYGRDHAALTATVVHYRARAAVRDVGKAMGLSPDTIAALAETMWGRSDEEPNEARVSEIGLDPRDRTLTLTLELARTLIGFPRHLSQHVGGFVISRTPLDELVPIENAAMENRTVIEWDKDDLNDLDMLKVDVLSLGMLTCIHKAFDLVERHYGRRCDLSMPTDDPAVYAMLGKADSIGVFQVESRAQMSMLPRLRPKDFYDLVIQVAIVRPGPIQGDMVHPYLRRREGKEPVVYPSKELRDVLGRTLGVPLFQEQAMQIAMVAAGFTADEADQLRRSMATFKRNGDIPKFRTKMIEGMVANGYDRDFATRCFKQIEGFGTYGFPESHAASFARLVYISAWLKCHYPAAFACALLNSQPMGFYAPAQIVRDAREHGVEVRPVDVNHSEWDCTLEPGANGAFALRLGFRQIKGFAEADARRLVKARGDGYAGPLDLARRAGLAPAAIARLAQADAFTSLGLRRRPAQWAAQAVPPPPPPLLAAALRPDDTAETDAPLPAMTLGEEVIEDYKTLFLSLKAHPIAILRAELAANGARPACDLAVAASGERLRVAGLTIIRQRPGTANGVIFVTIEDETGVANLVVWPDVFERYRRTVLGAKLLCADGKVQREGDVIHVVAQRLTDWSDRLYALSQADPSRFGVPARAGAHAGAGGGGPPSLPFTSRDFR